MSCIFFHTKTERALRIAGSERAHMGLLLTDLTKGLIPEHSDARVLAAIHPMRRGRLELRADAHGRPFMSGPKVNMDALRLTLSAGFDGEGTFWHDGEFVNTFDLILNTALALGSEPLRLFAKLHGQCELHAYVEGHNREWLAGVIQQGRDAGLYRDGMGWDELVTLLRENEDEPVVTSYSVCDQFPNENVGDWMPPWPEGVKQDWQELTKEQADERDDRIDAWYELSDDEKWDVSMKGLRETPGMELRPSLLARYGEKKSMFDLFYGGR